ncbi:hypothetical protein H634G_07554 [Metarhizium anisopliae BRIP 53293]|uniref:Uncharacterized protein n=1 Tax=Metarhizium anisopliae BRIP 53293 TaxID=1291518 RepID=A0A0D9NTR0_METAN|nr:hypothetical protein H634G_07554 [Metarhizium anisopliae BRIP 53293]KJK91604.1 hypothetical protein H633G_04525 [Metarhizium anisopliae BRIP 53284]
MQYPLVLVAAFAAASMAAPTAPPASTQSKDEMPAGLCAEDQFVVADGLGYYLEKSDCLALKALCAQKNMTKPAELEKCVTHTRLSLIKEAQQLAQDTKGSV